MFSPDNFPHATGEGYEQTSCLDYAYNCIAWAAQDTEKWWWPYRDLVGNEGYWPSTIPRELSLSAFSKLFKERGYKICKTGDPEEGVVKIAIYTDNGKLSGKPTHAARQLPNGRWTHKMGVQIDMTASLKAVEGPCYGTVARYMAKRMK